MIGVVGVLVVQLVVLVLRLVLELSKLQQVEVVPLVLEATKTPKIATWPSVISIVNGQNGEPGQLVLAINLEQEPEQLFQELHLELVLLATMLTELKVKPAKHQQHVSQTLTVNGVSGDSGDNVALVLQKNPNILELEPSRRNNLEREPNVKQVMAQKQSNVLLQLQLAFLISIANGALGLNGVLVQQAVDLVQLQGHVTGLLLNLETEKSAMDQRLTKKIVI